MSSQNHYIGRFAPSPTGPLHFGSLVAALGSFLDARSQGGHWLLRIDDLDPPRQQVDADKMIMQQLVEHGLHWDGEVIHQSHCLQLYYQHYQQLVSADKVFACTCTRKQIRELGGAYNGRCRTHTLNPHSKVDPSEIEAALSLSPLGQASAHPAYRFQAPEDVKWQDCIYGDQHHQSRQFGGDPIIKRKDGLFAYHLATAIDDALPGITHVIRGCDLMMSTSVQRALQSALGLSSPEYGHLPLAKDTQGNKLSKQQGAPALQAGRAKANLHQALEHLGQNVPSAYHFDSVDSLITWSITNWRRPTLSENKPV